MRIAKPPAGEGGPWVVQIPQPMPLLVDGIVDHIKAQGQKRVAFIGFSDAFGDRIMHASGIDLTNDRVFPLMHVFAPDQDSDGRTHHEL